MEIIGYVLAGVIGLVMGLMGGGGSILAVPILVYLFQFDEKLATGYSLFIVGFSALIGGIRCHKDCNVVWRTVFVFGVPSIIGVWLVRHYVIPVLPDVLFSVGDFDFTRRMCLLGLFAVLMFLAAVKMLKPTKELERKEPPKLNPGVVMFEGLLVGALTGLIGAGGGFIIVPVLILLAGLDMKKAIGTSLIIIAFKSLAGFFLGDALVSDIDWYFLLRFTSISLVGIVAGVYLSRFVKSSILKRGFGYFILIMSVFILYMEFVLKG